jgi:hypothetical protein
VHVLYGDGGTREISLQITAIHKMGETVLSVTYVPRPMKDAEAEDTDERPALTAAWHNQTVATL